jgi:hypothetical protein
MAYSIQRSLIVELLKNIGLEFEDCDVDLIDFSVDDMDDPLPLMSIRKDKKLVAMFNLKTMRTTVKSPIQHRISQKLEKKLRSTTVPQRPSQIPSECLIV